jgi:hypothetical protein
MPDITNAEVWVAGLKVVVDAPQVVIPLLFLVSGIAWWFRGAITQGKVEALAAQNVAITERLKLVQDRESDFRQKITTLERTVEELSAGKRTPSELAASAKVAAALNEVRSANTAIYDALSAESVSFRPDTPPNLKFTQPRRIVLDGKPFTERAKLYWNPLLFEMIRKAAGVLGKDQLKALLDINHVDGIGMQEKSYRYIEEAGLSVQGTDANGCWAQIFKLAKGANLPLEVEFAWQNAPTAAHPGLVGKFSVNLRS